MLYVVVLPYVVISCCMLLYVVVCCCIHLQFPVKKDSTPWCRPYRWECMFFLLIHLSMGFDPVCFQQRRRVYSQERETGSEYQECVAKHLTAQVRCFSWFRSIIMSRRTQGLHCRAQEVNHYLYLPVMYSMKSNCPESDY